jgi:hypothetical protein
MYKILHLATGRCVKAVNSTDFEFDNKQNVVETIFEDPNASIINLNGYLRIVDRVPSNDYAMAAIPKHQFEIVWFD